MFLMRNPIRHQPRKRCRNFAEICGNWGNYGQPSNASVGPCAFLSSHQLSFTGFKPAAFFAAARLPKTPRHESINITLSHRIMHRLLLLCNALAEPIWRTRYRGRVEIHARTFGPRIFARLIATEFPSSARARCACAPFRAEAASRTRVTRMWITKDKHLDETGLTDGAGCSPRGHYNAGRSDDGQHRSNGPITERGQRDSTTSRLTHERQKNTCQSEITAGMGGFSSIRKAIVFATRIRSIRFGSGSLGLRKLES